MAYFVEADDGFAINLDAVAYFNDEFVRFVNDWKMEISTKNLSSTKRLCSLQNLKK